MLLDDEILAPVSQERWRMAQGSAARREDEWLEAAKKRGGVRMPALRQYRLHRGITQAELAQMAGVTQSYLSRVEVGRRGCNPLVARRLAEVLEVDPR